MRAFWRIVATVVAAIGVGVGIEAALQPAVYRLGGQEFSAAFPAPPVAANTSGGMARLVYHGTFESPPLDEVSVVHSGPPLPKDLRTISIPPSALRIALLTPAHLPEAADLPTTGRRGLWTLPPLFGFRRTVFLEQFGSPTFPVWIGSEVLTNGRRAFQVMAENTNYAAVRAFLESFQPLS
jgi:hypothetical protein